MYIFFFFFFFQAEDGIRYRDVTGVQTCALPIWPRPRGDAYLWPWKMVYDKLIEACDVLEESFTARRSVLFGNPGLNDNATTHTLLMGIQMIKPGEIAWAHRHTLAAIRFVIKGDGKVYTVVDGEKCPMEPY